MFPLTWQTIAGGLTTGSLHVGSEGDFGGGIPQLGLVTAGTAMAWEHMDIDSRTELADLRT